MKHHSILTMWAKSTATNESCQGGHPLSPIGSPVTHRDKWFKIDGQTCFGLKIQNFIKNIVYLERKKHITKIYVKITVT